MEKSPWIVPKPSLLQIKISAFNMFYKHKLKKPIWHFMETVSWQSSTRAGQPGNARRELLQLRQFTLFPCFNKDLGSSRAPQHSKREPRFVGPCPCHKHPNRATQPLCLAFPPPHMTQGLCSPHSSPVNSQVRITLSGPCTAWHKRAPNLSCLTDWHHASRYSPRFPSS